MRLMRLLDVGVGLRRKIDTVNDSIEFKNDALKIEIEAVDSCRKAACVELSKIASYFSQIELPRYI